MAKNATGTIYPISALRAVVLHTQGLTAPNQYKHVPESELIVELVKTLGYVQIDTLQVVNRAHYLTLWSRLGSFKIDELDRLLYRVGQRRLYEGWGHAASISRRSSDDRIFTGYQWARG